MVVIRNKEDYDKLYYKRAYNRRCPRCGKLHWTICRDGYCGQCDLDNYYEEEHFG